jgi:hypothetical protein
MTVPDSRGAPANGAALAAFLSAGAGAFAMGLLVILSEADLFVAPTLYEPAGGLSGRSTLAVAIWLGVWAVLHRRWRDRQVDDGRVHAATLILIALGVLFAFPPVWGML